MFFCYILSEIFVCDNKKVYPPPFPSFFLLEKYVLFINDFSHGQCRWLDIRILFCNSQLIPPYHMKISAQVILLLKGPLLLLVTPHGVLSFLAQGLCLLHTITAQLQCKVTMDLFELAISDILTLGNLILPTKTNLWSPYTTTGLVLDAKVITQNRNDPIGGL